jgi:hypothetical protein
MSSFLRTKNGFVPTAVTVICREVYENGFWTLTTEELKFSDIEIDPVTSGPSDFTVKTKIPNGAPIVVSDSPGIKYEWQDGKIVKSVNQPSVANLEGNWFQPGSWLRRALLLLGTLGLAAAAYWYVKRTRRMA